jgi:transposase
MSEEQKPPGISEDDWTATPVAVRALITSLIQRIADLEDRLNQNSQNSSKPPSSDPPYKPRPPRSPSGRKVGGQKGHAGHGRSLKPVGQVNHVINFRPVQCVECGALLLGEDSQPRRHQVTELPRLQAEVTEYRYHRLTCLACGAETTAEVPAEIPSGSFGPRLQATVGYFTGRLAISQRDALEVLETVFHTEISLGSIPSLTETVSTALAGVVETARTYVATQAVKNVDETSWREKARRTWLWVNRTSWVTVFQLLTTRSSASAKHILGERFGGIVGSDRYSAYNWLDVEQRQICWAHLRRDFQSFIERGEESRRIGQALLDQVSVMFALWSQTKVGNVSRTEFQNQMRPVQQRVGELMREGQSVGYAKTSRTCTQILKVESALWTFVRVEGVEPTNNSAERALRRAVLWRRRSFGTQSESGSRFVERILTAVTTLRQQQRDVLDYLTEVCTAANRGGTPPPLLPLHLPPSSA